MSEPPLQPFDLSSRWKITYHDLRQVDPRTLLDEDADTWWYFREDLFHACNQHRQVLIDIGWYPEGQAGGRFRAVVIAMFEDLDTMTLSWSTPLESYRSKSLARIVRKVERWAKQYDELE